MNNEPLPGLPPPEPIEVEPVLEQVVRMRADCPKCQAVFRTEDQRTIQHIGDMGQITSRCGKCGQPLVLRRKLVVLANEAPNRAARRLAEKRRT